MKQHTAQLSWTEDLCILYNAMYVQLYMYLKAAPNMILTSIMLKCSAFCFVAEYFQLGGDSAMLADCHESEGDLLLVLSEVTSGGQWW